MTPVKSTNIEAAEYRDGRIRVQYKDGTIYAQHCSVDLFGEFMASDSKGAFARTRLTLLTRDGFQAIQLREPVAVARPAVAPVTNMLDEDECCAPRLVKALNGGHAAEEWACPRCGTEWRGVMQTEASVRRWSPQSAIQVIRLR